jgi:hypothetical protein
VSILTMTTLAAGAFFAAFHLPGVTLGKRHARLCGIAYHLLMLPAVAALPAPEWARMAGYMWMLFDVILDTADMLDIQLDISRLRSGVHVVAAVWLVAGGWQNGLTLGTIGTLHAAGFLVRLALQGRPMPGGLRHWNSGFNLAWILGLAWVLR